jgi:hypothetical protein
MLCVFRPYRATPARIRSITGNDMPMKMRYDVAQGSNVYVIRPHSPHDRGFRPM